MMIVIHSGDLYSTTLRDYYSEAYALLYNNNISNSVRFAKGAIIKITRHTQTHAMYIVHANTNSCTPYKYRLIPVISIAPHSSPLPLRGAPDYSTDTVSEFHAEAHRQLQVKDL